MNQICAAIIAAESEGDREYASRLVRTYYDVLDMIYDHHRAQKGDADERRQSRRNPSFDR
jgi:hypothetical protein